MLSISVLANLFMSHHENIWLENYKSFKIIFYRRYVDDTFCVFETEPDSLLFFDFINTRHPNMRFTMEKGWSIKYLFWMFSFITIHKVLQPRFFAWTFTSHLTNYFSFTAPSYKIGLGRTLVDRTFKKACSSTLAFATLWGMSKTLFRELLLHFRYGT